MAKDVVREPQDIIQTISKLTVDEAPRSSSGPSNAHPTPVRSTPPSPSSSSKNLVATPCSRSSR